MRPLSVAELLAVWERNLLRPPVERALHLLAAANPESSSGELSRLSVGRRDRRLLQLREWTFGRRLVSQADCPECGSSLELNFTVSDIAGNSEPEETPGAEQPLLVQAGGYRVELRMPDSSDLQAIAQPVVGRDGRRLLLERCISSAKRRGKRIGAARLPDRILRLVVERMAEADPIADVQLELDCPGCRHAWRATFDIASFFWAELDAWARRVLREIHVLASAYGWSESEILGLSAWRRQAYLELART